MRLRSHLHRLLGLAWTLSTLRSTEAGTCKTLADPSSTALQTLALMLNVDSTAIPVESFTEIHEAFPWVSKCFAAIDPLAVFASLIQSTQGCLSTAEDIDLSPISTRKATSACKTLQENVVPCFQTAMKDSIMIALDSTGTCCDDFLAQIKSLFGDSLDDMVTKLLQLGTKAMCSQRTYTNVKGVSITELCGYSVIKSFEEIESQNALATILSLLQIPSSQMCKAMEGESFTTTEGGSARIEFNTDDYDTMGICVQPVDNLVQYIASWPIFSLTLDANGTDITLANLFKSGKSVRGDLILAYMATPTNLPLIVLRAMDSLVQELGGGGGSSYSLETADGSNTEGSDISASVGDSGSWGDSSSSIVDSFLEFIQTLSYFADMSMHIPNDGGCTYADQSLSEPSTGSASSSGSSTTTTTATDTSAASVVKLAIMTGLSAAFFLMAQL